MYDYALPMHALMLLCALIPQAVLYISKQHHSEQQLIESGEVERNVSLLSNCLK